MRNPGAPQSCDSDTEVSVITSKWNKDESQRKDPQPRVGHEQVSHAGTQPLPPKHHLSLSYLRRAGQPPSHGPPTGCHCFPANLQAPTTRGLTRLGFGKGQLPKKQAESRLPTWPSLSWSHSGGPGEMARPTVTAPVCSHFLLWRMDTAPPISLCSIWPPGSTFQPPS